MRNIHILLHRLGFRTTYRGFPYLVYAIRLILEDDSYLRNLTTALYPAIAGEFHSNAASVEHSLRTLRDMFWLRGNMAYFERIVGYVLPDKPYVGEFIGILAEYLRLHDDRFFRDADTLFVD